MSTIVETVQQHLTDEPTKLSALVEATGLESAQVSQALVQLKAKGLAERSDGGWVAGGGQAAESRPRRAPTVAEPEQEAPRRKARRTKRSPKPSALLRMLAPPPAHARPDGRLIEFAITESGDVLFKIVAGQREGEIGKIDSPDARALYALMARVYEPQAA